MAKNSIPYIYSIYKNSNGVSTDSRIVSKGKLYFALKGENFDGNKFVADALNKGAVRAITDDPNLINDKKCIYVNNVLECLQELSSYHRLQINIPVIGITGSNGKTTSKELINAVLSKKFNVLATQGNLNNHIGVPLTLLSIRDEHSLAVIEMGANHIGEIKLLSELCKPQYGMITNIGKAHLEGFGSFDGVIKAKSELYQHLRENNATAFVSGDNDLLLQLSDDINRILYGRKTSSDCYGKIDSSDPFLVVNWNGNIIKTQLTGEYNFENIMSAICIGEHFGISDELIVEAISKYSPSNNRSQITEGRYNTIIMDAYNANPSSMEAAILNLKAMKNPDKAIIMGDMLELGEESLAEHQRILDFANSMGFNKIILAGPVFYKIGQNRVESFENSKDAALWLKENPIKNSVVLVKGSRGIKLEEVYPWL